LRGKRHDGFVWCGGFFGDFGQVEIGVKALKDAALREKSLRTLCFDELDDFHGGFEPHAGGSMLVTEDLSKGVDRFADESAEFVRHAVGTVLAESEESLSEIRYGADPEVYRGPVYGSGAGGGADGLACDEAAKDILLRAAQGVEK
jgi:hypothetical protein